MANPDIDLPNKKSFEYNAPVTELALLRLLPPYTITDGGLQSALNHCLQVLRQWDSRAFDLYTCLESPSLLCIIGSWASVAQHHNQFLPSAQNQAMLQLLEGKVRVEWMFHIDLPIESLPLSAPVIEIDHYTLLPGKLQDFAAINAGAREAFERHDRCKGLAQGRKVEEAQGGGHEMVFLAGVGKLEM